jgi:DNA polymerase-3 subunit chi
MDCCGDGLYAALPSRFGFGGRITTHLDTVSHDRHLVNLSDEIPPGFEQFAHVTEIISLNDDVRLPGRERFRFYREKGYPLESHDLAGKP